MRSLLLPGAAVLAALFAASPTVAQTGSFQVSGTACPGSGAGSNCIGFNKTGGSLTSKHNTNTFALGFQTGAAPAVTLGFEIYTQATVSTPVLINGYLMDADATGKPLNIVTQGKFVILPNVGFYRCTFATPQVLKPNTYYAVTYDTDPNIMFPFLSSGTQCVHYWHPSTSTSWNGPFTTVRWSWRLVCPQGNISPVIANTGVPTIGKSFNIDLGSAAPNTAALYVFGASSSAWGPLKLPFALDGLGAAGCSLYASIDLAAAVITDGSGSASVPFPVPNLPAIVGVMFYNQYLVVDAPANSLGIVTTALGTAQVGK